jgi:hypothetical protein
MAFKMMMSFFVYLVFFGMAFNMLLAIPGFVLFIIALIGIWFIFSALSIPKKSGKVTKFVFGYHYGSKLIAYGFYLIIFAIVVTTLQMKYK